MIVVGARSSGHGLPAIRVYGDGRPDYDVGMPQMAQGPVFAGRAPAEAGPRPVLGDPSVIRERSWLKGPDQVSAGPPRAVRSGVFAVLTVAAILVVALAIALAAR